MYKCTEAGIKKPNLNLQLECGPPAKLCYFFLVQKRPPSSPPDRSKTSLWLQCIPVPALAIMCYKSPAKELRSIKRMTKFLEIKPQVSSLTISILPSINILPPAKHLESFFGVSIDVPPVYPKLSIAHVQTTHVLSQLNSPPPLPICPQSTSYQPQPVQDLSQSVADQQLPILERPLGDLTPGQFSEIM